MPEYALSSSWVRGFSKVLRDEGCFDEMLARATPAVQVAMKEPSQQLWWPLEVGQGFVALIGTFSNVFAERVGHQVVQQSIGPIIMPLIKVVMAVSGRDPRTLFSRMPQLVNSSLRGVTVAFTSPGPNRATVSITYPFRIEEPTSYLWRGTASYLFELAGKTAQLEAVRWTKDRMGFSHDYTWS